MVSWYDRLWLLVLRIVLHHALGRLIGQVARLQSFWTPWAIRLYIRAYKLRMHEARVIHPQQYKTLNKLFTRRLRDDARPLCTRPDTLMAPCDGLLTLSLIHI